MTLSRARPAYRGPEGVLVRSCAGHLAGHPGFEASRLAYAASGPTAHSTQTLLARRPTAMAPPRSPTQDRALLVA